MKCLIFLSVVGMCFCQYMLANAQCTDSGKNKIEGSVFLQKILDASSFCATADTFILTPIIQNLKATNEVTGKVLPGTTSVKFDKGEIFFNYSSSYTITQDVKVKIEYDIKYNLECFYFDTNISDGIDSIGKGSKSICYEYKYKAPSPEIEPDISIIYPKDSSVLFALKPNQTEMIQLNFTKKESITDIKYELNEAYLSSKIFNLSDLDTGKHQIIVTGFDTKNNKEIKKSIYFYLKDIYSFIGKDPFVYLEHNDCIGEYTLNLDYKVNDVWWPEWQQKIMGMWIPISDETCNSADGATCQKVSIEETEGDSFKYYLTNPEKRDYRVVFRNADNDIVELPNLVLTDIIINQKKRFKWTNVYSDSINYSFQNVKNFIRNKDTSHIRLEYLACSEHKKKKWLSMPESAAADTFLQVYPGDFIKLQAIDPSQNSWIWDKDQRELDWGGWGGPSKKNIVHHIKITRFLNNETIKQPSTFVDDDLKRSSMENKLEIKDGNGGFYLVEAYAGLVFHTTVENVFGDITNLFKKGEAKILTTKDAYRSSVIVVNPLTSPHLSVGTQKQKNFSYVWSHHLNENTKTINLELPHGYRNDDENLRLKWRLWNKQPTPKATADYEEVVDSVANLLNVEDHITYLGGTQYAIDLSEFNLFMGDHWLEAYFITDGLNKDVACARGKSNFIKIKGYMPAPEVTTHIIKNSELRIENLIEDSTLMLDGATMAEHTIMSTQLLSVESVLNFKKAKLVAVEPNTMNRTMLALAADEHIKKVHLFYAVDPFSALDFAHGHKYYANNPLPNDQIFTQDSSTFRVLYIVRDLGMDTVRVCPDKAEFRFSGYVPPNNALRQELANKDDVYKRHLGLVLSKIAPVGDTIIQDSINYRETDVLTVKYNWKEIAGKKTYLFESIYGEAEYQLQDQFIDVGDTTFQLVNKPRQKELVMHSTKRTMRMPLGIGIIKNQFAHKLWKSNAKNVNTLGVGMQLLSEAPAVSAFQLYGFSPMEITQLYQRSPYSTGLFGIWRPQNELVYKGTTQNFQANTGTSFQKDFGTFEMPQLGWQTNAHYQPDQWIKPSATTAYSGSGFPTESKNILGQYSAALYGYKGQVVMATGFNTREDEFYYTGFEEPSVTDLQKSDNRFFNSVAGLKLEVLSGNGNQCLLKAPPETLANYLAGNIDDSLQVIVTGQNLGTRSSGNTVNGLPQVKQFALTGSVACVLKVLDTIDNKEVEKWAFCLKGPGFQSLPYWTGNIYVYERKGNLPYASDPDLTMIHTDSHTGNNCLKAMHGDELVLNQLNLDIGEQYVINAWVKIPDALNENVYSYGVDLSNTPTSVGFTFPDSTAHLKVISKGKTIGNIINGWQQVQTIVEVDANYTMAKDPFKMTINARQANEEILIDDIRIFPYNGQMKSYVYEPQTLRVSAVLDENNYATFYYYDESGKLYLIKKETDRGIMSIQESVQYQKVTKGLTSKK